MRKEVAQIRSLQIQPDLIQIRYGPRLKSQGSGIKRKLFRN
jgi:hypothetical protein